MSVEEKYEDKISLNDNKFVADENLVQDDVLKTKILEEKIKFLMGENTNIKQSLDEEKEKFEHIKKVLEKYNISCSNDCEKEKVLDNCDVDENSKDDNDCETDKELMEKKVDSKRKTDFCDCTNSLRDKDEKLKLLNEKVKEGNEKLAKSKNMCMQLKKECQKAHKMLSEEIGEKLTTNELSNRIGWRGRAEQIQQLQRKVNELQNRLNDTDKITRKNSTMSKTRISSSLQNLKKESNQQIEMLSKELEKSSASVENYKKFLSSARSRTRVLENQLATSRKSIEMLYKKQIHDGQMIESLQAKLESLSNQLRNGEYKMEESREKMNNENIFLRSELRKTEIQLEYFKVKLEEREKEISILRHDDAASRKFPCLPVNKIHNESATTIISDDYLIVAGLAAEAEKERLLELVTVLHQRLNEERNRNEQLSQSLRQERQKTTNLKKKPKMYEEQKFGTGIYRAKSTKSKSGISEILTSEEAFSKLELLEEEFRGLKTKYETLQFEKMTDLEVYKKMLQKTRRIFQDATRENSKSKLTFDEEKKSVMSLQRKVQI